MNRWNLSSFLYRIAGPAALMIMGLILLLNPDSLSALISTVLGWALLLAGVGFLAAAVLNRFGTLSSVVGGLVCFSLGGWLLRHPLVLAAGIGRIAGILLIIRGAQEWFDSRLPQGRLLAAISVVLGILLVVLPMTASRVVFSLCGLGVLTKDQAVMLGAVGPMLRASGVSYDVRMTGYAAYGDLSVEPITAADGDSYARCEVRLKELLQSFQLIREAIGKIPEGPIAVPVKGSPSGEYFMRIEQPRGEAIYYVKGNGTKNLDRFRLRTPTTSTVPPMHETIKGCHLADVPLLILTIDPCISCTER